MQNYVATFKDGTTHTRSSYKDLTYAAKIWYADETFRVVFDTRLSVLKQEIKTDSLFAPEYYEDAEVEIVELEVTP